MDNEMSFALNEGVEQELMETDTKTIALDQEIIKKWEDLVNKTMVDINNYAVAHPNRSILVDINYTRTAQQIDTEINREFATDTVIYRSPLPIITKDTIYFFKPEAVNLEYVPAYIPIKLGFGSHDEKVNDDDEFDGGDESEE